MSRYKLSPEERAAEKERKDNLRSIMKGLDVKKFDDLKDVFKMMVEEMLENGLDGEWTSLKKWTGKRKDWGQIHSQLEIFFADRLPR